MSRHRAPVRPRYGRIILLFAAVAVTGVALLGRAGFLPAEASGNGAPTGASVSSATLPVSSEKSDDPASPLKRGSATSAASGQSSPDATEAVTDPQRDVTLPDGSGEGKRIVFSESRQRVWLVDDASKVQRTYLVSGSLYDNLDPGTYSVYSRSEQAYGIDDSGTMKYFVRFTQGDNAAIGFHDIPIDNGKRVQSFDQLGTPLSHGCIRQKRVDAIALWDFAPLGTAVVVTA